MCNTPPYNKLNYSTLLNAFNSSSANHNAIAFSRFSSTSNFVSTMAVNSTEEECHNAYSVVVFPEEGTTHLQYKTSPNTSHSEVVNLESEMCLNAEPNAQSISNLNMNEASNHATCLLDADIEKGHAEIPKQHEESSGFFKSEEPLGRSLQREICLQLGGKFMQLLMNHGHELPKFVSRDKLIPERIYDTATNRSRKYKRSPSFKSFNSRRIVLLFSVLSCMGTIILIYLTLRVRQIADGNGNV